MKNPTPKKKTVSYLKKETKQTEKPKMELKKPKNMEDALIGSGKTYISKALKGDESAKSKMFSNARQAMNLKGSKSQDLEKMNTRARNMAYDSGFIRKNAGGQENPTPMPRVAAKKKSKKK
jgi:hypothetical protein